LNVGFDSINVGPMKLFLAFCGRAALLVALPLLLTGCPSGQSASDEEKEPHFLAGKSRVNAMDFLGATESFEKALEVNPRSAAAHFELGWLYERKETENPAAAIYHFEKFLKFRPQSEKAEIVRQRILACKQELARTVSLGPLNEKQQRDIEKLAEENRKLTDQNKQLADEVLKWRLHYAGATRASSNSPVPQSNQLSTRMASTQTTLGAANPSTSVPQPRPSTATRTHVVKQGETPAAIARQYQVKLDALMNANPGLDPRKLRPGQTINLP
jgi:LysM repeat protein